MKNISTPLLFLILITFALRLPAETLSEYVETCQQELGFGDIPELHCDADGIAFAQTGPVGSLDDHLGYLALNADVDLTFACRWVDKDKLTAFTLELMIHNRRNGKTCFFSAKEGDFSIGSRKHKDKVLAQMTSITSPYASTYWRSPEEVDKDIQCVGCHVAGPYIASKEVADEFALFGLMNNGHDTVVPKSASAAKKYRAVGETFSKWNSIIESNIERETCASGCHSIGAKSTVASIIENNFTLLPSLKLIISIINKAGTMPPHDPASPYRWINADTQLNGTGDHESLDRVKKEYANFYCRSPIKMEARPVGSDHVFGTNDFIDKLDKFNLHDGLVCLNADQSSGRCIDYETRYLCDGEWTRWHSADTPNASGDWEEREDYPDLCPSPTAIQARYYLSVLGAKFPIIKNGPPDRLNKFKTSGLACRNDDQPNRKDCSNYMVRFICE